MSRQTQVLPAFSRELRYPVEVAAGFLSVSRAHLWKHIKAGTIATIRDGKRVFVPGTEIVRLSSLQTVQP